MKIDTWHKTNVIKETLVAYEMNQKQYDKLKKIQEFVKKTADRATGMTNAELARELVYAAYLVDEDTAYGYLHKLKFNGGKR